MGVLDPTRTIYGDFGEVWMDGKWLTNFNHAEASVEVGKEEIRRSGTRWTGHKVTSLTGTGTISGYKVTTDLVEAISQVAKDRGKPFVTELVLKLDDPDSYGAYRVRLKGVQFDTIPLMNFQAGSIVEEELPFTFSGFEFLDVIHEQ
ncbi:phage tail tube protein [Brevibacillus sp. SYP-B805]|uniref:phage tail tube protein n=1 Tax=Brevibacillus sp. SYP-B805 TaxID=1578199 RepID=UPI0013EC1AC2|nr:phage tail tube protein [Brevibacillus sp. SYP-B805]NGQ95501.1 phage tail tube protein [Brevibacillus sp. SYP-B805]